MQGKVALITGGASGIGASCAEALARAGARVILTDIDAPAGEALATRIGGHFQHQDVTDEARWSEVIAEIAERFGRLDVLVANAGIAIIGPLLEMSLADWRRQNAVNLDGVFLSVKHAIPLMRQGGGGSIILMSSIAGLRGSAGLAGYSATKGAVRLLAKSIALECAAARDGIRCNSVHPGVIETAIWGKMPQDGRNAPVDPHALAAAIVPLGEVGLPEDIAAGVLYLASDSARHVTGSELVIDGGATAGRSAGMAR